jgi:hypothetical protein
MSLEDAETQLPATDFDVVRVSSTQKNYQTSASTKPKSASSSSRSRAQSFDSSGHYVEDNEEEEDVEEGSFNIAAAVEET